MSISIFLQSPSTTSSLFPHHSSFPTLRSSPPITSSIAAAPSLSALRYSSHLAFYRPTLLRRATQDAEFSSGGPGGGGNGDKKPTGGDGSGQESDGDSNDAAKKKMTAMSMSQKITLCYAALVGAGGVMGFLKSGSQKSLAAGGFAVLGLLYVYSELPVRPTFASTIGLGLSISLLVVMGSRFKKSGKVFPAGLVSVVSFIMAGGYVHGILRSLHA